MAKKILLADDSLTIQKVVQITFARQDAELTTVDNGDAALAKIQASPPDIVLADVMMPGKSGYDLAQAIRSNPATARIPVLLLAGAYEPFDEAKAQSCGANGHILKPFESTALVQKVNELLAGGGAPAAAPKAAAPAAAAPKPVAPAPRPTAAPAPKPAAPAPKPAAPAPKPAPVAATPIEDFSSEDSWDLSEEPAVPPPPPPKPAAPAPKPMPAAAAPKPAPKPAPSPPPPAAAEFEVEVATEDSWDLSEEPAAPPPPPPAPARAPAPKAAPPPAPAAAEFEVAAASDDGWDLSEEPSAPAAAEESFEQMLEVEEPVLETASTDSGFESEVEVASDKIGGHVWDLSEGEPLELDSPPAAATARAADSGPADDSWDLSEEVSTDMPEPPPAPVAKPEPVRPPPPPPPAARPAPAPVAAKAPAADISEAAVEQAVRAVLERELPNLIGEVTRTLAAEIRSSVPRIAERVIQEEIAKITKG